MTEAEKKLVDSLIAMSLTDFGDLSREDLIFNMNRLLDVVTNLREQIKSMPPVGMDQVIRIQGSHESLIPDENPPDRPGPVFGGC